MASQSQRTSVEQRNLVRSSSNCRWGSLKLRKERLCKTSACSPARATEPRNGGLTKAEDAFGGRCIQPFCQCAQHQCHLVRRRFQPIQRSVTSGRKRRVTRLTANRLDALGLATLTIPNQGMDLRLGDSGVWALVGGTGEALGAHSLGGSTATLQLTPRSHRSRRRRPRRGVLARASAGGAVQRGAWFEEPVSAARPGAAS